MYDIMDIVKNIENIYESNNSFSILKDFERVIDELDIYVYENWEKGELIRGPYVKKHWVMCSFMWPKDSKPDPAGAKRLEDYDCRIKYEKNYLVEPRKIRKPDDIRPGTKKGKLDRKPVWIVHIKMPKELIVDTYDSYMQKMIEEPDIETEIPEPEMPMENPPADMNSEEPPTQGTV